MKTSAILLSATAAIVSASGYGCTEGAMRCSGTGFETCNFNNWVYRPCGPATQCFMVNGNFPTCGYPQSNYAPQPPTYQQQPPTYQQQPPAYQQSYQQPPSQQSYQSKSNFASTQQYQQPAYGGQQQSYCTEGAMKCDGTGFSTCNFNNWVYRPCGTGTECFMVSDNHPTCGWPKSPSYGQTPSYPTNQYTPQPYTPSPPPPQPYTPPTPPSYTPQPRKDYTPPTPPSYTPQPPKDYTPAPKCDNLYGFCVCSASYTAGYVKGSDCLEYGWENNASCVKKGGVKCEKSQPPTYGQSQPPAPSYGSSQPPAPSYGNSQPPAPSYGQGQPQYHKK